MPDQNGAVTTLPVGVEAIAAPPPASRRPSPFPVRPKRSLRLDPKTVVESVLRRAQQIEDDRDRGEWMERRVQRYAKYRGWMEEKTFPWVGASNVDLHTLMIAELRTNAGLNNVAATLRPLLRAKAQHEGGVDKEDRISRLIDHQLIVEPGPDIAQRRIGDYISTFLQDGNAVAYTPWVRDEGVDTHVTYRPPVPDRVAPADYLLDIFHGAADPETGQRTGGLFPSTATIEMHETQDHMFIASYEDARKRDVEATVEVYTEYDETTGQPDALALVITKPITRYDGPVMLPLAIADLLVPTRCVNLQPPTSWNPGGAPYVFLKRWYRIDEIRRLKQNGDFNYLTDADLDTIIAGARSATGITPQEGDALEEQKDRIEGTEHHEVEPQHAEDLGHLAVDFLVAFDRWDIDGDGLSEDVHFVIAREAEVLCAARRLQEQWPAPRAYRPLAEAICIPVPGRWYGISLLELGEALSDLMKGTFDQSFDAWTIANLPSGFYAASSKLSADIIQWAPGQFYPVPGNPRETIYIPQWPQRDQQTALGIVNLAWGFFERVMGTGALQSGNVPTGKSSALRTFGTTHAILQQGDVRADQLLIRLFGGLAQVAANFHRLNRHFLPEGKEFRVLGWDGEGDAYQRIETIADIDEEIDFEFRPDFLLSNPAMLSQAIQSVLGVVATPLAFQLGVTDARRLGRLMRDYVRALRLDPNLYVTLPKAEGLPAILAKEAINQLMQGRPVRAVPLEGAEQHLRELMEFSQSDAFGALSEAQAGLFMAWMEEVGRRAQQERIAMSAQAFQQSQQQGNGPNMGGVPTTVQEPAPGTGAPAAEVGEPMQQEMT